MHIRIKHAAALGLLCVGSLHADPAASKSIRLFVLSGQSNMAKLDPAVSFTPAVQSALSNDEVIVVKDAESGQPIRRWDDAWQPSAGMTDGKDASGAQRGDLYKRLMTRVNGALKGRTPTSVAFIWMQGERDAKLKRSGSYAESLRRLIRRLRNDLACPTMVVVIGRLSDHLKGDPQWDAVRAIQVNVADEDPRGGWIDTDDCNGPTNDLHMTPQGYAEMGRRFAAKAIALLSGSKP